MPIARVGSIELSYQTAGSGEPVLLLHGQGGRADAWSSQLAALARHYQPIAVDLRGHGASSSTSGPLSMTELASDLVGLARELRLGRCHVVGHSLGGMVALQLAVDAPSAVKTLALVNTTACGRGPKVRSFLMRSFIRLWGMKAFARLNAKLHLPESHQAELRERFIRTMGECPREGYLAAQAAVDGFDLRARLGEITCPVLVVHSALDVIPLEDKQTLVEGVRQGRLVELDGSRHIAPWDQPERLNSLLLEFLGERRG